MRDFGNYTKRKVEQRDRVVDVVVDALLQEELSPACEFFVMNHPSEILAACEVPVNLPVEPSSPSLKHRIHCVPCDFRGQARFICDAQNGDIVAMRHQIMIHPNEHVVMNRFATSNFHHDGFLDSLKQIYTCVLILRYLQKDHEAHEDIVDYLCTKIVKDVASGEDLYGADSYNMDAVHRALERG